MLRKTLLSLCFIFLSVTPAFSQEQSPLSDNVQNGLKNIAGNQEVLIKQYQAAPAYLNDFRFGNALCWEFENQPEAVLDFFITVQSDPILECAMLVTHSVDTVGKNTEEVHAWATRAEAAVKKIEPKNKDQENMKRKALIGIIDIAERTQP